MTAVTFTCRHCRVKTLTLRYGQRLETTNDGASDSFVMRRFPLLRPENPCAMPRIDTFEERGESVCRHPRSWLTTLRVHKQKPKAQNSC